MDDADMARVWCNVGGYMGASIAPHSHPMATITARVARMACAGRAQLEAQALCALCGIVAQLQRPPRAIPTTYKRKRLRGCGAIYATSAAHTRRMNRAQEAQCKQEI